RTRRFSDARPGRLPARGLRRRPAASPWRGRSEPPRAGRSLRIPPRQRRRPDYGAGRTCWGAFEGRGSSGLSSVGDASLREYESTRGLISHIPIFPIPGTDAPPRLQQRDAAFHLFAQPSEVGRHFLSGAGSAAAAFATGSAAAASFATGAAGAAIVIVVRCFH